jgi:hypothetical protein
VVQAEKGPQMKWYENDNSSADEYFNVEIEDPDGGFKPRGSFDSLEKAKREGERLSQFYGKNYKIRIYPTPKRVWCNWHR